MRLRIVGFLVVALALAGCSTLTIEDLALRCDAYGFERKTKAHAQCVQQEVRAYEANRASAAQRMQAAGQALQQSSAPSAQNANMCRYNPATGRNQSCMFVDVMGKCTAWGLGC